MAHPTIYVLVLIGPRDGTDHVAGMAHGICSRRPEIGWQPPHWLAPREACEIGFTAATLADARAIRSALADEYEHLPVDICLIPANTRRKRLLIADMESTIIEQEMLDELADAVGLRAQIADITARAMRGELTFEPALRERLALLTGLDAGVLERALAERVTLTSGAATLVKTMRAHGAYAALVSGGFTHFTAPVADRLGFDEHQANVLEIVDGRLAGRVHEPILGRQAKRVALERIAAAHGIELTETLAVGDGANDLDMIAAAGLGVAFHAKPGVRAAADALDTGAVVTHGDLTALLYLQGYSKDQHLT